MLQELYKIHLKDVHTDLERYLYQDCYCPGEIYDASGFFFDIYEPEDECFVLGTAIGGPNLYWHEEYQGLYVVCKEQILEFTIEEGMIVDALRMDATENNLRIFKTIVKTGKAPKGAKLDRFENNHLDSDLKQLFKLSDAILID